MWRQIYWLFSTNKIFLLKNGLELKSLKAARDLRFAVVVVILL